LFIKDVGDANDFAAPPKLWMLPRSFFHWTTQLYHKFV